jgi:hypothetical protein
LGVWLYGIGEALFLIFLATLLLLDFDELFVTMDWDFVP